MSGGCSTLMVPNHRLLGGHHHGSSSSSPPQRQNLHFVHSPSRIYQQQQQQRQEELEQERLLYARVQPLSGQGNEGLGLAAERDRGQQFCEQFQPQGLGMLQEELDARVGTGMTGGHHHDHHHLLFQQQQEEEIIDATVPITPNPSHQEGYESHSPLARQVFRDDLMRRAAATAAGGSGPLEEVFRLPTPVRTKATKTTRIDLEKEALRGALAARSNSPRSSNSPRGSPQCSSPGGSPQFGGSPRGSPRGGGGKVESRRVLSPGKFVLKKGLEPPSWPGRGVGTKGVERSAEVTVSNESGGSSSQRRTLWVDQSCDAETSGQWIGSSQQHKVERAIDGDSKEKLISRSGGIEGDILYSQGFSSVPLLCPGTPSQPSSSSPTCSHLQSPDVNKCFPVTEPRSVLDLSVSPQLPTIRATLPRRFRESFLENMGGGGSPATVGSPRTLDFENCEPPKVGGSSSFDAIMRRDPQFPNLVKPARQWADLSIPQGFQGRTTTTTTMTTTTTTPQKHHHPQSPAGEELVVLPSPSYNHDADTAELSSLDEWEAATTASTQHERLAKQWMASLMEDLRGVEDSTSPQETEECTTPFTPGVESSPHMLAFQRSSHSHGSPSPSDYTTGDDNQGGLEYLQVESPSDTPRGGFGFCDDPHNDEPAVVGHELVTLLLACAEAVSTKSLSLVNHLLQKLGELASPDGTSMQRVAAYFTEGLASRVAHLWPHIYQPLPIDLSLNEEEMQTAFHLLNHVAPYTKFAHFTANDIILQAFEGADRVHVIDFDVKQGLQWPALFQSLAVRECGPPSHIRITGIGECKEDLQDTGDRLAEFAEEFNIPFSFHVVIDRLEDVRLWMLHVKENEAVAVNCIGLLHRLLYDSGDAVKDFLNLIGSTRPRVVALVEQEGSHNGVHFEGRFLESLQYYSALFDSLEANLARESGARLQVEQLFAREIRNILACEGQERVERHEQIAVWRSLMDQTGFVGVPLGESAQIQAQILLRMFDSDGYTLAEENGALTLGWMDQPLFTVSAWKPDKDFVPTGTSLVATTSEKQPPTTTV